jgi:hypothetical protein
MRGVVLVPYAVLARRLSAGSWALPALLAGRREVVLAFVGAGEAARLLAARVLLRVDML